ALSIAASARQAPLHAITTEIVGPSVRGEYIAVRNAASQVGIPAIAAVSASAFDAAGFSAVAWIAASATLLIPACCIWWKDRNRHRWGRSARASRLQDAGRSQTASTAVARHECRKIDYTQQNKKRVRPF